MAACRVARINLLIGTASYPNNRVVLSGMGVLAQPDVRISTNFIR